MRVWQIPVSLQGSGILGRAHFFLSATRKHFLVRAACGRRFNPGFAVRAKRGMYRCAFCRGAIRRDRA